MNHSGCAAPLRQQRRRLPSDNGSGDATAAGSAPAGRCRPVSAVYAAPAAPPPPANLPPANPVVHPPAGAGRTATTVAVTAPVLLWGPRAVAHRPTTSAAAVAAWTAVKTVDAAVSTVTVVVGVDDPAGGRRNRPIDEPDLRAAPGVNVMVRLKPAIVIDEPVTPVTVPDAMVTVLGVEPAEPTVPPPRPPANRPPPNPPGAPGPAEPPAAPAARSVQVPDAGAGVILTLVALTVLGAVPDAPAPGVPVAVMHVPAITAASDASTV